MLNTALDTVVYCPFVCIQTKKVIVLLLSCKYTDKLFSTISL